VVLLAILLNCGVMFMMVSFVSFWRWMWAISYACDAVTVANVVVSFFVVYIDDRGMAYDGCRVVARRYARGLFVCDLLSVLPLDYFVVGPLAYLRRDMLMRARLRLNRLFGLVRVVRFLSEYSSSYVKSWGSVLKYNYLKEFLVHGQVTIIFVMSVGLSVCLFVCLFVQSFSQLSLIRFRSNLDVCYMSGSSCVP